jgi:3',5'-nucleoside bisphosphate phosphatase
LLGYWIDPAQDDFVQIEEGILRQEQAASKIRIALMQSMGIHVTNSAVFDLAKNGIVTGEMIAEAAMQQDENKNNPLLEPYYQVGSRSDNPYVNFYWDFCSQGKSAYVPVQYIGLSNAVEIIQRAGGIAVLAHPGNNIHEDEGLLHAIVGQGVCGLEVYSSYHTAEQTEFYRVQAKQLGLAMSCGSDFHGKTKPKIEVGSVDCESSESTLLTGLLGKRNVK